MSKAYREALEKDPSLTVKDFLKKPGKRDKDGKLIYFTQQGHKKECDINYIIKKYDKTGLIGRIQKIEGVYGDVSGADFRKAQELVLNSKKLFNALPGNIKKRFNQSPEFLYEFMEDPGNREEAIKLGLIRGDWKPETDGLGEHVKKPEDYEREVGKDEPPK